MVKVLLRQIPDGELRLIEGEEPLTVVAPGPGDYEILSVGEALFRFNVPEGQALTRPISLAPPEIEGEPAVGATLTVGPGIWSGAETIALQWLRDGAAIAGATSETYTLTVEDIGPAIRVRERARNEAGVTDAVSDRVRVAVAPEVVTEPTLSPDGLVDFGEWRYAARLTGALYRDGEPLVEVTDEQVYRFTSAGDNDGAEFYVEVVAENDFDTVTATSPTIPVTFPAPQITTAVQLGELVEGFSEWAVTPAVVDAVEPVTRLYQAQSGDGTYISGEAVPLAEFLPSLVAAADKEAGDTIHVREIIVQSGGQQGVSTSAAVTVEEDAAVPEATLTTQSSVSDSTHSGETATFAAPVEGGQDENGK